jgi:hypothetical protein
MRDPDEGWRPAVPECEYNENLREREAVYDRPLVLESTRSKDGPDAHRDMDHFDEDEELARLRRAIFEMKKAMSPKGKAHGHTAWTELPKLPVMATLRFICEAFDNIDETLERLGPLPRAWRGSSTLKKLRGFVTTAEERERQGQRQGVMVADLPEGAPRKTIDAYSVPNDPPVLLRVLDVEGHGESGRRYHEGAEEPYRYTATLDLGDGDYLTVDIPKEAHAKLYTAIMKASR